MKNFLLFVFLFTFIVTESNLRGKENVAEDNEVPIEGYVEVPQASESMLISHKKDKDKKKEKEKEKKKKEKEKKKKKEKEKKKKEKEKKKDKDKISLKNPNDGREMLNHFAKGSRKKSH